MNKIKTAVVQNRNPRTNGVVLWRVTWQPGAKVKCGCVREAVLAEWNEDPPVTLFDAHSDGSIRARMPQCGRCGSHADPEVRNTSEYAADFSRGDVLIERA